MIGKTLSKGRNAYGLARYLLAEKDCHHQARASVQLIGGTLPGTTPAEIGAACDALLAASESGNRKTPPLHVFHAVFSLGPSDRPLTTAEWQMVGDEAARELGYAYYSLVLHDDGHMHMIGERADPRSSKLVSDQLDGERIVDITQRLADRLGLSPVAASDEVASRDRVSIEMAKKGVPPPRHLLRETVAEALKGAKADARLSASEFVERLAVRGVDARPAYGPDGAVKGWSFRAAGMDSGVSGSRLGPALGWSQLQKKIEFDPARDRARITRIRSGFAWVEAQPLTEGVRYDAPAASAAGEKITGTDASGDDPRPHHEGRPDRLQDRDDRREDADGGRPGARHLVNGAAGGQGGPARSVGPDPRFPTREDIDDRAAAGPGSRNSESRTARAIAVARLRTRDWSSLRDRAKPAVRRVAEQLDRAEQRMALRLEKARRMPPENFFHKNLRQQLKAIEKTQGDLAEACQTARKERAKVRRPRGLDRLSPLKWLRHWEERDKADRKVRAADALHDLGKRALAEKRRLIYPALDQHRRDRDAQRADAVAEAEARNAEDRKIIDAARAVLRDHPELALKGAQAVLEAAERLIEREEAQRRALAARPAFRPVPEPEPPTGWRP